MSAELDAILARLSAGPSGSLNVHDSRPTNPAYPYVIVFADEGVRDSDRESDTRVRRTVTFETLTIGQSAAQCRAARGRVNDALEDWTPTVTGRSCSKVEHDNSRRTFTDDTLPGVVLFSGVDEWSVVSNPT